VTTPWSWLPDPASGITVRMQEANGLNFELAECGEGDRLILCLHGFPELNFSWRHQMPLLAAQGWRVWAPNLRGYGASSKPEGRANYTIDRLLDDVAALIDVANAKEVMIIAHDWGAVIAWMFAIRRVRRLSGLIILNVPHPKVAQREIRRWRQFWRSWYIFFFQLPRVPEWLIGRNKANAVRRSFTSSAIDKSRFADADLDVYAAAALRPGALTAMINYYRALIRNFRASDVGDGKVDVPTLMIWGESDRFLNINCVVGTDEWVSDLTLHRLPRVSHWVQQEAPERVNALISDWLNRT
jgi:epoxide hydrolase 4